jgi:hypothetical protein
MESKCPRGIHPAGNYSWAPPRIKSLRVVSGEQTVELLRELSFQHFHVTLILILLGFNLILFGLTGFFRAVIMEA